MKTLLNLLAMGGYASYIWSAYGIAGVFFIMSLINLKRNRLIALQKLHNWFKETS